MNYSYLLLLFVIVLSCSNSSSEDFALEENAFATTADVLLKTEVAEVATDDLQKTSENIPVTEKKIIKTADIIFESKDLNESSLWIKELIVKNKGYITSETSLGRERQSSINFLIRIPSATFDNFITGLGDKVRYFDQKSIERKDVTEEFIDVESRLKTKKQLENRYIEILRQAKTVNDILEIENKLSSIREEIESTEGRLKYLQNQISMSSITLQIYKKIPYSSVQKETFFSKLGTAFVEGFHNLTDFFISLIYIWPFIILTSFVLYFIFKRIRKRRQRKQ